MIRQIIDVAGYWTVIIWYNVDYRYYDYVERDLDVITNSNKLKNNVYRTMSNYKAYGVTITNPKHKSSVVILNKHKDASNFMNTLIHELDHVKVAICKYYGVPTTGEESAYTIGYLTSQTYNIFSKLLSCY